MSRAVAVAVAVSFALLAGPERAGADEPGDRWFARDKALHFTGSAGLAAGGYGAGALLWPREPPRLALGAGLALTAGVGKEVLDRWTGGDPSLRDLAWDAVGTATGLLIAWALDRFVF